MTTIRPNAEPPVSSVLSGDIFLIDGATGVRAFAATNVALLDANFNANLNNINEGFTSIATAAGTTVLTAASTKTQYFTGTTTQTVTLPVVSTLQQGQAFTIRNASTGVVTVNSSGSNLVATVAPGASVTLTCILLTGTTAASWQGGGMGSTSVASGKVFTVSNSLTLVGTDGTTMTFPTTSATIARTDASQTFTGAQTVNIPADNAAILTLTAAASTRLTISTDASANVLIRSANSVDLRFGVNTTTWAGISNAGIFSLYGSSSGTTGMQAAATASGVLTLPSATDTLVGRATTDTLTNKTLVAPALGAATGTSLVLTGGSISFGTSGTGHVGTLTNDNAAAGVQGEYAIADVVQGSAVGLTTSITATIASVSLTAGDWDVWGQIVFRAAASTNITLLNAQVGSTTALSGTMDAGTGIQLIFGTGQVPGGNYSAPPIRTRISIATTTTINMIAQGTFTVSTLSAFGTLQARRMR